MKLSVFSAKAYDRKYIDELVAAKYGDQHQVVYHSFALSTETVSLAKDSDAICAFVNDNLSAPVLEVLHEFDIHIILLRCAGYNNVDLEKAEKLGFSVANVPSYSPEAVAEFAIALIQTLNRKTHRAFNRVREGNFNLDGLMGHTLHGKTVGIVGLGKIGLALAKILNGFGCHLIAYDPRAATTEFKEISEFVELDVLLEQSDVVSLHCPLLDSTRHIINHETLGKMKKGAMLANTSRGGLIDTRAAIDALKSGRLGGLALDVYEAEGELFYDDHSGEIIHDDELMRLLTFPNVIVCGHQAFLTEEALREISEVTLQNLENFVNGEVCKNSLVNKGEPLVRRGTVRI